MKTLRKHFIATVALMMLWILTACSNVAIDMATEGKVRDGYEAANGTVSNSQVGITDNVSIPSPDELYEMEAEVILLTNEYRVSLGLDELEEDISLTYVARIRAPELVTNWSHVRPDGTHYYDILDAIAYPSLLVGENLAKGQDDPEEALEMWIASPGHNANLTRPEFSRIGVGVYADENGKLYYVQIFAK